jgi:hypothetical protein
MIHLIGLQILEQARSQINTIKGVIKIELGING